MAQMYGPKDSGLYNRSCASATICSHFPCRAFYELLGVTIDVDPDQDTTDLMKCLDRVKADQKRKGVVSSPLSATGRLFSMSCSS